MKKMILCVFTVILFMAVTVFGSDGSNAYALIIAVGNYSDETILDLNDVEKSAEEIADYLKTLEICQEDEIKLLENPSLMILKKELAAWIRKDVDNLILYYTGHGFSEYETYGVDSYILAADSYPAELKTSSLNLTDFFRNERLENHTAKNTFLFIDSCYSGGITADLSLKNLTFIKDSFQNLYEKRNFQFILSSGKNETSLLMENGEGYFTHYLIEGLKGAANKSGNEDEYIQIAELANYIKDQVSYKTEDKQHPQILVDEKTIFASDYENKKNKAWNDFQNAFINGQLSENVYNELINFAKKTSIENEYDLQMESYIKSYYKNKDLEALSAKVEILMRNKQKIYSVQFITSPNSAKLYLDGVFKGDTPKTLESTEAHHIIRIEKEGYKPFESEINFEDSEKEKYYELETERRGTNYLSLSVGNPLCIGAEVYIDNELNGRIKDDGLTIENITVGEHFLVIDGPAIKKIEKRLLFTAEEPLKKEVITVEKEQRDLLLFTEPSGVNIYVNGMEQKDRSPVYLQLEVGQQYELKFEKYGYVTKTENFQFAEKGVLFKKTVSIEKNKAPFIPKISSPEKNSKIKKTALLKWSAEDPDGDELVYDLFVGRNGSLRNIVKNLKDDEYLLEELEYDTEYSWQVIAKDNFNQTESPVWNFKTSPVPTLCNIDFISELTGSFSLSINSVPCKNSSSVLLKKGLYMISAEKTGYKKIEFDLNISEGDVENGNRNIKLDFERELVFLIINSTTEGASVFLNGVYSGVSPCMMNVDWGKGYTISVSKAGYSDEKQVVELEETTAGKKINVNFNLEKKVTTVYFKSTELNSRVFLNDRELGIAPLSYELKWGEVYDLKVETPGHAAIREEFILKEYSKKYEKTITPEKLKVDVEIHTNPDNTNVFLNGRKFFEGNSNLLLEWGSSYTLMFEAEGYTTKEIDLKLVSDDLLHKKTVDVMLDKKKTDLCIESNVTGVEVFINSQSIGYAPIDISVDWGTIYKITAQEFGYKDYSCDLDLSEYIQETRILLQMKKSLIKTTIESTPSDASIYIDDILIGKTPLKTEIEWGKHQILFEKYGFIDFKKDFDWSTNDAEAGKELILRHKFDKKTANVSINSTPDNAIIYINDVQVGHTPYIADFLPGKYNLLIKKDQYKSIEDELKVGLPDVYRNSEKSFKLIKEEVSVEIDSDPEDCGIFLNNIYKGITPLTLRIPWGDYSIDFRKKGYEESTNFYTIDSNTTITQKLDKLPIDFSIQTIPEGADIYLDNAHIGLSPLTTEIFSGQHLINVEKKGYERFAEEFLLQDSSGGEVENLTINLKKTSAKIDLKINVQGAIITLDGKKIKTPSFDIDPGEHWLEVEKDGFSKFSRKIIMHSAQIETINIVLVELKTILKITEPIGSNVSVDGNHVGRVPLSMEINSGKHQVETRNLTGMKLFSDEIIFEKGDMVILTSKGMRKEENTIIEKGTLQVESNPSEAKVYLNGNFYGSTPFKEEIEVGYYQLIVNKDGFRESKPENIFIENGVVKQTSIQLAARYAHIKLKGIPAGSILKINDEEISDYDDMLFIPEGLMKIEVKNESYLDYEELIKISEGENREILISMFEQNQTNPSNIETGMYDINWNKKNIFSDEDTGIFFGLKAENWNIDHEVYGIWYKPNNEIYYDGSENPQLCLNTDTGIQRTLSGYEFLQNKNSSFINELNLYPGKWYVRIFIDGNYVNSSYFEFENTQDNVSLEEKELISVTENTIITESLIKFESPESLSIYIDGVFQGWVPLDINVQPGSHKISVEDNGKVVIAEIIDIKAGEIMKINQVDKKQYTPDGMIFVEKGWFITGNDSFSAGVDLDEIPSHTVNITYDYYIDENEVTNKELCKFLNEMDIRNDGNYGKTHLIDIQITDSMILIKNDTYLVDDGYEDYPAVHINWLGAIYYANWLSRKAGLPEAYDAEGNFLDKEGKRTEDITEVKGYRLPTEMEWEYAALGTNKSKEYLYSGSDDINEIAVYLRNSNKELMPVKTKAPNSIGIYDMSGNVCELCYDIHVPYTKNEVTNWFVTSSATNKKRIIKGGSFKSSDFDCRIKDRDFINQQNSLKTVGFRLVLIKQ